MTLIALLACIPDKPEGDTASTEPQETGDPSTDDTGDGGDSGEAASDPDLAWEIRGDWEGATLTMHAIDLGADDLTFGAELAGVEVTGSRVELELGAPTDLQEDPKLGVKLGVYVGALHDDDDGDGSFDEGEALRGVSTVWAVYVEGDPGGLGKLGVVEGWNALLADVSGKGGAEDFELYDPLAIPIETNLAVNETLLIEGEVVKTAPNQGLVLAPYVLFDGGSVQAYLYDEPMGTSFSIALDGEPPADHQAMNVDFGAVVGMEVPLLYADNNGDGAYNEGDYPSSYVCDGGLPIYAVWMPAVTDLITGWSYGYWGMQPGWIGMKQSGKDDVAFVTGDLTGLHTGDCPLAP